MASDKGVNKSDNEEDIAGLFESLCGRFKPGKVAKATVFHVSIDEKSWTIAVGPNHCSVAEGPPQQEPDCSLKTTKALFLATFRGEYMPSMMDFMSGKIKSNNPMLLMVLKDAFGD